MTRMRAAVVCESTLARMAETVGPGQLFAARPWRRVSGGRQRASVLADALEALTGAVFLDQGWLQARRFLLLLLGEEMLNTARGSGRDYKTALQEVVQQRGGDTLAYCIIDEAGPDHDKHFTAGVIWNGKMLGSGNGKSKKEAEQQAARNALKLLKCEGKP